MKNKEEKYPTFIKMKLSRIGSKLYLKDCHWFLLPTILDFVQIECND